MNTKRTSKRGKTFGQRERYLDVTKVIFNERLKCKDTLIRNIDITTEDAKTSRKVRRIIEKRMCQTYHRHHKRDFHECGNKSRHNMKRAVSYELFILGQIEDVENVSRGNSTHWKRKYDPVTKKIVFKKKYGYNTFEEAKQSAIELSKKSRRYDKAINVYKCPHCNKYHIGHESDYTTQPLFTISATAIA